MSREVKFRAWDKEDKKIWKVVSITESIWGDCEEAHIRVCEFHENPSKKETDVRMSVDYELMQYTGLKDKHGTEIFEGDIVSGWKDSHWHDGKDRVLKEVEWTDELAGFNIIQIEMRTCEVIGNIYEHSHLL